ncbi:hypothetical protein C463_00765 [Halorubrum californiense DSM 19288]|uniref:Lipoprotein n=1 Tax=Halorubrum californiense DSM 19288 TaxID=1227465 RepID=M0ENS3_9EURY|nr:MULTISPECIES: DUF6517 family protein [Halorubrum]ELZ48552.1 hypothetical protein C463_00765 [Halorubrum californiense DSM 19288]TKX69476.1 hypothetical protein EXE40_10775 [Halorubrum sp. GN11GM_10-3_MGM]
MKRRGLLAALAASTSVAIAGCAGEDGSYEFDAEPARVPESAYANGYTGEDPESYTVDREFNVTGVNAEVTATTWVARYTNPTTQSALFVASTPNASVAGQSVNPLVRVEGADLIQRLLNQINQQDVGGGNTDIQTDDIEERGEVTRTILDEETTVPIFETTISADVEGTGNSSGSVEDVPVLLYIATVQHTADSADSEDVIAMVGLHPEQVGQRDQLLSMMEAVEH